MCKKTTATITLRIALCGIFTSSHRCLSEKVGAEREGGGRREKDRGRGWKERERREERGGGKEKKE